MAKKKDTGIDDDNIVDYARYEKWAQQRERTMGSAKQEIHEAAEKITNFAHDERIKIAKKETISVPREFMWIGGVFAGLLVLNSYPTIVLGAFIGAAIIGRIGCAWFKS